MKSFKAYIEEARKGGYMNPFMSTIDNLDRYKDDPDVFITFTRILKVGINPQSEFETPFGVYSYPLKEAWKMYADNNAGLLYVPYAGTSPYVTVIKRKGKHIDDIGNSYNSNDYSADIKKIYKYAISKMSSVKFTSDKSIDTNRDIIIYELLKFILKDAGDNARSQTIGGQMWNITRIAAAIIKSTKSIKVSKRDGIRGNYRVWVDMDLGEGFESFSFFPPEFPNFNISGKPNFGDEAIHFEGYDMDSSEYATGETAPTWTNLWLALGYTSIADRSNLGIIHPAEKTQCVFFSKSGYDVLDTFLNKKKHVREHFTTWEGGTWTVNNWFDGIFKKGLFTKARWLDGAFLKGEFIDAMWERGIFSGDLFSKSTWHTGTFKGKLFSKSTWFNGTFKSGVFKDSRWSNGSFEGGTFDGNTWEDGLFTGGTFKSGNWLNGIWVDGKWEGGVWFNGYDKKGNLHDNSPDNWPEEKLTKAELQFSLAKQDIKNLKNKKK
jgi:hypothetical protein